MGAYSSAPCKGTCAVGGKTVPLFNLSGYGCQKVWWKECADSEAPEGTYYCQRSDSDHVDAITSCVNCGTPDKCCIVTDDSEQKCQGPYSGGPLKAGDGGTLSDIRLKACTTSSALRIVLICLGALMVAALIWGIAHHHRGSR